MSIYALFKPLVFQWCDVISKGTNKEAVKHILTPKGISHTFELPMGISNKLFEQWERSNLNRKNNI